MDVDRNHGDGKDGDDNDNDSNDNEKKTKMIKDNIEDYSKEN